MMIYRWKYPKAFIIRFFTIPHARGWYTSFNKPLRNTFERVAF